MNVEYRTNHENRLLLMTVQHLDMYRKQEEETGRDYLRSLIRAVTQELTYRRDN